MPDQIKWPKGTPKHLTRPIAPTCERCQQLVPTGTQHSCPQQDGGADR